MPALFLGLAMLVLSAWLAHEPVLFVAQGERAVGEVVDYEGPSACRRGRRACHFHRVQLADGESLRLDLGNPVPLGATLDVTWVPGRPDIAEPAVLMGPWWVELWQRLGFGSLLVAALGLFWTLWGCAVLWDRHRRQLVA